MPDTEPYRAWQTFTFTAIGHVREVDLFIATPGGLLLVEIKSHPGTATNDGSTWLIRDGDTIGGNLGPEPGFQIPRIGAGSGVPEREDSPAPYATSCLAAGSCVPIRRTLTTTTAASCFPPTTGSSTRRRTSFWRPCRTSAGLSSFVTRTAVGPASAVPGFVPLASTRELTMTTGTDGRSAPAELVETAKRYVKVPGPTNLPFKLALAAAYDDQLRRSS